MAAKLTLDKFQLLWYLEGAARGSHLRWDIYRIFVNEVYPQLDEKEREVVYTYAKRDLSYMFESEYADKSAKEQFLQMLARFNPANQYKVSLKKGHDKSVVRNDVYKWNDKYYIGWSRFCNTQYIKKIKQKPFKKCTNRFCEAREKCIRFTTYEIGDKVLDNNVDWFCKKCDFIIESEVQDENNA